ncbi:MAG: hypothetical protein DMF56_22370 [Acidobacteria bacterium]|nr:MAG: hypothetical protein DMF56_22370 [Acidobacteriota bacterium]
MRLLFVFLFASLSAAAQDSLLFPRFSVTASSSPALFETNARIDPEVTGQQGTLISLEHDLGLDDSRTLQRFSVQWRPFRRHELAATHFSAPRSATQPIVRTITFRNQIYSINTLVTTQFDLDYTSLTYTYWARRTERDGFGITIGAAALSMDASVSTLGFDVTVTQTQRADTDVPVALAGLQGRVAFLPRLHGEASVATLPRITIGDYSGDALTAAARLEYRPLNWLGIGAAYHYFRLNVDVEQTTLRGAVDMTIRGPEAFVRLAF